MYCNKISENFHSPSYICFFNLNFYENLIGPFSDWVVGLFCFVLIVSEGCSVAIKPEKRNVLILSFSGIRLLWVGVQILLYYVSNLEGRYERTFYNCYVLVKFIGFLLSFIFVGIMAWQSFVDPLKDKWKEGFIKASLLFKGHMILSLALIITILIFVIYVRCRLRQQRYFQANRNEL